MGAFLAEFSDKNNDGGFLRQLDPEYPKTTPECQVIKRGYLANEFNEHYVSYKRMWTWEVVGPL